MKKSAVILILLIILSVLISCNLKNKTVEANQLNFFNLPVWEQIPPLMEDTEKMIKKSDWNNLLSKSREIAASFSGLTESLNKIETSEPDYSAILKLQIEAFSTVTEVFKNNLAAMDNLNKLLTVDSEMASTKTIIQKYKKDLPEGYFQDLSENNEKSDYLLNWGSRLISIIQNKILMEKEIKTQEDIEVIKTIIEKAEKDNRLEELQTYLETEAAKGKAPPSILFSLSLVYGRKGLVKEEYKTIERLEKKVKQAPKIAFNLSLVYGRKKTLKSQIDKAEAEARALLQGFISVTSTPAKAEVYIDGVLKGTTPFTTKGLKEGSYSVEIRKDDYSTVNRTVVVKAKKTAKIEEELTLLPGGLTVNSDPAGSTVSLDGEEIGVTPLEIPEIEVGEHELTIFKEKFGKEIRSVKIKPGVKETLDIKLSSSIGTLSFVNLTDGAIINLDGKRVYPVYISETGTKIMKDIPIGNHELSIQKEGYITITTNTRIIPNENININAKLSQNTPYNNTRFKKKLHLDGNGDYGEIRYSSNLNLRSKISIEAWVYMDDLSINSNGEETWGYRDSRPIISQSHESSTAGNYTFGITPNELFFAFETIDSRYTGSFKFEEGRWYNIAVTHDFGNGSSTKLYVDGKIIRGNWVDDSGNSISGDTLPAKNARGSYYIGSYNPKIQKIFFSGYIDELRVWNRIRNKEEINLALTKEPYLPEDGLILYYKFNSSKNEIISNLAGNNNLKLYGDASISN